jgi:hypothetical protein
MKAQYTWPYTTNEQQVVSMQLWGCITSSRRLVDYTHHHGTFGVPNCQPTCQRLKLRLKQAPKGSCPTKNSKIQNHLCPRQSAFVRLELSKEQMRVVSNLLGSRLQIAQDTSPNHPQRNERRWRHSVQAVSEGQSNGFQGYQ